MTEMYDFNHFKLSDMISCSRTLRELSLSSNSMEESAQKIAQFFYNEFFDGVNRTSHCALVRVFKTHNFFELDEQLQSIVAHDHKDIEWPRNMKAMVLLASAGDEPEWNHRTSSKNHQVIPLPSPELVERMPMISQLVKQFGFDLPSIVCPHSDLLLEPEEQLHGLFFVSEAEGSPYIPDQSGFVTKYGIKSVIGFGAMLPSGNLFSAILFSKQLIPKQTELLFKPLALSVKSAILQFDGLPLFDGGKLHERIEVNSLSTVVRLKSELAAIHNLLNVSEETVQSQASALEEASKELASARDAALEASAVKSAFVANISHELRTPLTSIVGMSELLLASGLNSEQLDLSLGVDESARNLLAIVNDLLDFSKMEAGKLHFEVLPFSLADLIQDVCKTANEAARRKRLALLTNFDQLLPTHVLGDRSRIRQILENLVTNAIKFTNEGQVVISVRAVNPDSRPITVRFAVEDSGIGISEDNKPRLFKPFSQLSHARTGGTGLGLSICKTLVELMDGSIGVESETQKGSKFWFELPLPLPIGDDQSLSTPVRYEKADWASRVPKHSRILVVEDNRLIRNLVLKQLFNLGVEGIGVESGWEAVSTGSSDEYDLILMDCNLPDISGFEVTRLIRENEKRTGRHTPIIAVTALAMKADKQKCLDSGMDDYLTKPVVMEQLIEKLEYWLVIRKSCEQPDH
jgi:signal transduction histidine kinase/ActR/RegA family two-component response regulator